MSKYGMSKYSMSEESEETVLPIGVQYLKSICDSHQPRLAYTDFVRISTTMGFIDSSGKISNKGLNLIGNYRGKSFEIFNNSLNKLELGCKWYECVEKNGTRYILKEPLNHDGDFLALFDIVKEDEDGSFVIISDRFIDFLEEKEVEAIPIQELSEENEPSDEVQKKEINIENLIYAPVEIGDITAPVSLALNNNQGEQRNTSLGPISKVKISKSWGKFYKLILKYILHPILKYILYPIGIALGVGLLIFILIYLFGPEVVKEWISNCIDTSCWFK